MLRDVRVQYRTLTDAAHKLDHAHHVHGFLVADAVDHGLHHYRAGEFAHPLLSHVNGIGLACERQTSLTMEVMSDFRSVERA